MGSRQARYSALLPCHPLCCVPVALSLTVNTAARGVCLALLQAGAAEAALLQEQEAKGSLAKEAGQLRLILTEAEDARAAALASASEANACLEKEVAAGRQVQGQLEAARCAAAGAEGRLAEARCLLDSVTRELGLLSSRHHRAVQERNALRRERGQLLSQLAAARAAMAAASERAQQPSDDGSASDGGSSYASAGVTGEYAVAFSSSSAQQAEAAAAAPQLQGSPLRTAAAADQGTGDAACAHGNDSSPCLMCICERFLAAGVSPPAQLPALWPSSAAGGALTRTSADSGDSSRASREWQAAALAERLDAAEAQLAAQARELARLRCEPAALAGCSLKELRSLEGVLEEGSRRLRTTVVERSVAEAGQRAEAEGALCSLCMEAPRRLVFNCGHQTCMACGDKITTSCPFCRTEVSTKIRLWTS